LHCFCEVNQANKLDQVVVYRQSGEVDLRLWVINYVLPNGEIEKLVTNIFDPSFSVEMFGELYRMCWGVETCFRTLKSRLEIEIFSSAKEELILQDFYVSVFVYNLTMAASHEVEAAFAKSEH
jgi:IS4 transposase